MNSDAAWDKVYATKQMAAYPDNALIRFVARHYYGVPDRSAVRFLDIGCGYGASTWYLAREGFDVEGVDVSQVAIDRLKDRLMKEGLVSPRLLRRDLTKPFARSTTRYDCIIDISSACYLPERSVPDFMDYCHEVLKPGGRIFSIAPAYNCAPELFNAFAPGVTVRARLQTAGEVLANFAAFRERRISGYAYEASGKSAHLYVIEAKK